MRLKVQLGLDEPIATLTSVWPGAGWCEREVYDLFGIVFDGHPDLRRLMMPEDWEGHPLRKDYPVQVRKDAQTYMPLQVTDEEFRANMERDRDSRTRPEVTAHAPRRDPARQAIAGLRAAAATHERLASGAAVDAVVGGGRGASSPRSARAARCWSFGNGGSAADAQHFVAELVGRFERRPAGLAGGGADRPTRAS